MEGFFNSQNTVHTVDTGFLCILIIFINSFSMSLFLFNISIEIFQKLSPGTLTVTAKSSFEEALLGLQKLMSAVNDIREGISR